MMDGIAPEALKAWHASRMVREEQEAELALALALRRLRNSPDTMAAGERDCEDACAIREFLARSGFRVVRA